MPPIFLRYGWYFCTSIQWLTSEWTIATTLQHQHCSGLLIYIYLSRYVSGEEECTAWDWSIRDMSSTHQTLSFPPGDKNSFFLPKSPLPVRCVSLVYCLATSCLVSHTHSCHHMVFPLSSKLIPMLRQKSSSSIHSAEEQREWSPPPDSHFSLCWWMAQLPPLPFIVRASSHQRLVPIVIHCVIMA